ncbi:monovalent cation:H+ antiporter, CPA1 (nhx1) [Polyrhizophydium stewartii]|uniref:Sodium/hydrogen exchanger n=1 Tax=Polyrhizophydium stewartii TaxID=2732419 RepID=A0ABR4MXW0_9FUNG
MPPEEISASWAILILISILFVILFTSYLLQRWQIRFIHETVVSILLGSLVGAIIKYSPIAQASGIADMVTFDHRYFFNLLLPPIILNSGYDMKRRNFFKNFGSILIFAFGGTFVSTIVIGVLVYAVVLTHVHGLNMSFLDCVVFGAILSSTDPVTILSIFHQLKVDPKLYAIIFGESVLNDSVAIVLFSTLGKFQGKPFTLATVAQGSAMFVGVLTGSVLIGIILALLCALMLKHTHVHHYPTLESCLVSLLAYSSYLLSNAIQLSGIVSLLFCGIILKHYAYDNLSVTSRRTTKYMFRVLSQMSENFVFIYLGVTLFTITDEAYYPGLIIPTLVIIMVARYVSTIPLAGMINLVAARWSKAARPASTATSPAIGFGGRRLSTNLAGGSASSLSDALAGASPAPAPAPKIPRNHQLMLWWAGLRGAIAFALAFNVEGAAGPAIRTTTLAVCVVSIVVLGGTTHLALERLHIRTGVSTRRGPAGVGPGGGAVAESDSSDDAAAADAAAAAALWRRARPAGALHGGIGGIGGRNSPARASASSLVRVDGSDGDGIGGDPGDADDPDHDQAGGGGGGDMGHWFLSFDARWLKPLFTQSGWGRRGRRVSATGGQRGGDRGSPSLEALLPIAGPSAAAAAAASGMRTSGQARGGGGGANAFGGFDYDAAYGDDDDDDDNGSDGGGGARDHEHRQLQRLRRHQQQRQQQQPQQQPPQSPAGIGRRVFGQAPRAQASAVASGAAAASSASEAAAAAAARGPWRAK